MTALVISEVDSFVLPVIRGLGEGGINSVGWTHRGTAVYRRSRYCIGNERIESLRNPANDTATISRINALCATGATDTVLAVDAYSYAFLARNRGRIHAGVIPCSSPAVCRMLNHKWEFAQFLLKHGLPHPCTTLVGSPDELQAVEFGPKVVVKELSEDHGYTRVLADRKAFLDHAAAKFRDGHSQILIQEHVPGRDIGVSVLAVDGRAVAWTQQEHLPGGGLRFGRDMRAVEPCLEIVRATGFSGVAHFDLISGERTGEVTFLECNVRFWASTNASIRCGINFPHLAALVASGRPVPARLLRYAPQAFFRPSQIARRARNGTLRLRDISLPTIVNCFRVFADPLPGIDNFVRNRLPL